MARPRRNLSLEQLEDRLTPTTTGMPWADPKHLTLSFAPDGTKVGRMSSTLFQSLNAGATTHDWQLDILRAFQTWSVRGNANVSLVADDGQDFGTPGLPQGDPRFGDLRIAEAPLASSALSTANPFTWTGTTWGGDTVLNSNYYFSPLGTNVQSTSFTPYDLYSVMLHEAGHTFGMEDTQTDPSSVMYGAYKGVRTGLSGQDVADFQSLYGTRQPDQWEGAAGNNSFATAVPMGDTSSVSTGAVVAPWSLDGDVGSTSEADYYKVKAVARAASLTVNLTTSRVSSLDSAVTVFDASHHALATATASDPLHGDLSLTLGNVTAGSTYYVKVAGATDDVFSIGGYRLSVAMKDAHGTTLNPLPNAAGLAPVNDNGANRSLVTATDLTSNATHRGRIDSPADVDYYQLHAPPAAVNGTGPYVLTAEVWGSDATAPLHPYAELWSGGAQPQRISTGVLSNDNGVYTIQFTDATPGAAYYLVVRGLTPGRANNTGNYFLSVNFHKGGAVQLDQMAGGNLTHANPVSYSTLAFKQNALTQLSLSTAGADSAASAGVQMQLFDSSGSLVFTLVSHAGQPPATGCVYLVAGDYQVRYAALNPNGFTAASFNVTGQVLSDPIGPRLTGGSEPTGGCWTPDYIWSCPSYTTLSALISTYARAFYF